MSAVRKSLGLKLIIDANCVTLYVTGKSVPVLIERPGAVSVGEWEKFWIDPIVTEIICPACLKEKEG